MPGGQRTVGEIQPNRSELHGVEALPPSVQKNPALQGCEVDVDGHVCPLGQIELYGCFVPGGQ